MLSQDQLDKFDKEGYLVLENFIDIDKCKKLKTECDNIIESNRFLEEVEKISVFAADETPKPDLTRNNDLYFLTSTDKIRPFLESKAKEIVKDGEKSKQIFNKIGHALHALNPVFKEISFDANVKDVFKSLNYKKPIVCQSMYIFKQPFIGGEVKAHQDGIYLHTEPLKICGIWIALEDCTLTNGCLQFVPGSNKGPLATRFVRNPNKEEFDNGKFLVYTNGPPKYNYDNDEYMPVPVKAGDAILIDGLVVHRSSANLSPSSRHIYTFHVYEGENSVFSANNWMEPSDVSFLPLYDN